MYLLSFSTALCSAAPTPGLCVVNPKKKRAQNKKNQLQNTSAHGVVRYTSDAQRAVRRVAATDLHRGEGVVDVAPVPRRFAEHLMRGGGTWACVTAARLWTLVSTDFSRHRENSHYIRDIIVKIFLSGVHGVLRVAYWGAGHRHEELELLREMGASRVTPEPHTTDARATADNCGWRMV